MQGTFHVVTEPVRLGLSINSEGHLVVHGTIPIFSEDGKYVVLSTCMYLYVV